MRYVDPDGRFDAETFYEFAQKLYQQAPNVAVADSPMPGPCDVFAAGMLVTAIGAMAIGGCIDLYNYVASKVDFGSVVRTKENNTNEFTAIYRTGSGNGTNLTPRTPRDDSTGLSYTLTKPDRGPYTVTSMEAVNATGVLVAVKDGPNHVAVIPTDMSKMPEWQATREHANENPHVYTKILQSISLKIRK